MPGFARARIGICFKIGVEESFGVAAHREKDVFSVVPTGFGKSLIYQMFSHGKSSSSSVQRPTVIVISSVYKRGIGSQHTTFISYQNAACSSKLFSLSSRLCFGGKLFD